MSLVSMRTAARKLFASSTASHWAEMARSRSPSLSLNGSQYRAGGEVGLGYSPGVLDEVLSGFVVVIIVILESSEITGVILQGIVSECRGKNGRGERT